MRPAPPAERKRAISSLGAYNPGFGGQRPPRNSVLGRLLESMPSQDLPEVTNNWSGYQVLGARTHVAATSASGTWVVPKVSAPSRTVDGYSAIWVGIGGSCLDVACHVPDQTLIQLGTSEAASPSGQSLYEAWYEVLPAAEVVIPGLRVAPGDKVSASLGIAGTPGKGYNPGNIGAGGRTYNPMGGQEPKTYNLWGVRGPKTYNRMGVWGGRTYNPMTGGRRPGNYNASASPETWVLSISVKTPSGSIEHWSKTISYASSLASAEWIVEGPSAGCNGRIGQLPLADYHSVGFSGIQENAKAPSLGLSNLVVGYDPYGELSLPVPTFLDHTKTATYYLPFVPRGSAEAAGKASCGYNTMGVWGDR